MRFTTLIFSIFSVCASAAEIPQGARVLLRMENSINTRTAKEGDTVYLRTATPIMADRKIVVPIGSYVQGVITHSLRSARVHGRAELTIALDTLMLPNGTAVDIAPRIASVASDSGQGVGGKNSTIRQDGDSVKDATQIGAGAIGGLFGGAATGGVIGAIAGNAGKGAGIGMGAGIALGVLRAVLARGQEVQLRPGTMVDAIFERPVVLPD